MRTRLVGVLIGALLFGATTTCSASIQMGCACGNGGERLARPMHHGVANVFLTKFDADPGAAFALFDTPFSVIVAASFFGNPQNPGPDELPWRSDAASTQPNTAPSAIVVWAFLGLCWAGGSCWREQQGRLRLAVLAHHRRMANRPRRAPWPDHVRTAILKVVVKNSAGDIH